MIFTIILVKHKKPGFRDSNTPSIRFYRNIGAEAMSEWTVYRLSGDSLLF